MSIYTKAIHFLSCPSTPKSATCYPVHLHQGSHFLSRPSTPRSTTCYPVRLHHGQPLLVCPSTPRSPASCLVHLHQDHPLHVMSIYTKVIHFLSCPSRLRSATSCPVELHQGQPLPAPSIYSKVSHMLSCPSTARSASSCPVHLQQGQPLPVLSSHTQGLQVRSKAAGPALTLMARCVDTQRPVRVLEPSSSRRRPGGAGTGHVDHCTGSGRKRKEERVIQFSWPRQARGLCRQPRCCMCSSN